LAHQYPLDEQAAEVKEMLQAAQNTGHSWPPAPASQPEQ
jgi:hypothetical protein